MRLQQATQSSSGLHETTASYNVASSYMKQHQTPPPYFPQCISEDHGDAYYGFHMTLGSLLCMFHHGMWQSQNYLPFWWPAFSQFPRVVYVLLQDFWAIWLSFNSIANVQTSIRVIYSHTWRHGKYGETLSYTRRHKVVSFYNNLQHLHEATIGYTSLHVAPPGWQCIKLQAATTGHTQVDYKNKWGSTRIHEAARS